MHSSAWTTFSLPSNQPSSKRSDGFSLIELTVILAIISALVIMAIPIYTSYIDMAKMTLAHSAVDSVRKNLESYHIDFQDYPDLIDFNTGKDNLGRTVFSGELVKQLKKDLHSIDSYVKGGNTYTLIATATDDKHSVITLTPQQISY